MASFEEIQKEIESVIGSVLDLPEEDYTPELQERVLAYLDELGTQEAAKVDALASFIRLQSGFAEAMKKEAQDLSKRARAIENRIANLKAYYMRTMVENGLTKVQGQTHKISLRNSKSVCVEDAAIATLPPEFVKIERTPVKTAIKKALEDGKEIAGCSIVEKQSLLVA